MVLIIRVFKKNKKEKERKKKQVRREKIEERRSEEKSVSLNKPKHQEL
jgi:hypothetical protein